MNVFACQYTKYKKKQSPKKSRNSEKPLAENDFFGSQTMKHFVVENLHLFSTLSLFRLSLPWSTRESRKRRKFPQRGFWSVLNTNLCIKTYGFNSDRRKNARRTILKPNKLNCTSCKSAKQRILLLFSQWVTDAITLLEDWPSIVVQ